MTGVGEGSLRSSVFSSSGALVSGTFDQDTSSISVGIFFTAVSQDTTVSLTYVGVWGGSDSSQDANGWDIYEYTC
jgi:hypothetical protein